MVDRFLNFIIAIIMKQIKYTLLALVALFIGTTSADAQKMVSEDLTHLGSFNRIEATVGWDVTFTQSNTTSIKVTYSEEVADNVRIKVKNGRLILGLDNNWNDRDRNRKNIKLRATVSAPTLKTASVTTGAEIKFSNPLNVEGTFKVNATTGAEIEGLVLTANKLDCEVTTGATVEANLSVEKAFIRCTTGGDVDLIGKAETASLECTTGADINAKKLIVQYGDCRATTSGDISITIKEQANVQATTGGDLTIYGNPKEILGKRKGVTFK